MVNIGNNIKRDAKQYLNSNNNILNIEKIGKTINIFQNQIASNGIEVRYNGIVMRFSNLLLNELKVNIEFDDAMGSDMGFYDSDDNIIKLNSCLLKDNEMLYKTLLHEFSHKIQYVLSKKYTLYQIGTPEYNYLKLLNSSLDNHLIGSFGVYFNGKCYLTLGTESHAVSVGDRHSVFYHLCILDRISFAVEDRFGDLLDELKGEEIVSHNKHDNAIKSFKKIYCCDEFTNQEIYQLIDSAQIKIMNREQPVNNLEAAIMYDMTVMMAYHNKQITSERYQELTDFNYRERQLNQYYNGQCFSSPSRQVDVFAITNNMDTNGLVDFYYADGLTPAQRNDNPRVMLKAVLSSLHDHPETKNLIPDMDLFWRWYCLIGRYDYPEEKQDEIAEIFDDRFKFKYCNEHEPELKAQLELEIQQQEARVLAAQGVLTPRERFVFSKYDRNWPTEYVGEDFDIGNR